MGGRDGRRQEDVRGNMRRWWRREEVQESQGPGVPWSHGPRYLKVTFKYELDSKEGPSCNPHLSSNTSPAHHNQVLKERTFIISISMSVQSYRIHNINNDDILHKSLNFSSPCLVLSYLF